MPPSTLRVPSPSPIRHHLRRQIPKIPRCANKAGGDNSTPPSYPSPVSRPSSPLCPFPSSSPIPPRQTALRGSIGLCGLNHIPHRCAFPATQLPHFPTPFPPASTASSSPRHPGRAGNWLLPSPSSPKPVAYCSHHPSLLGVSAPLR